MGSAHLMQRPLTFEDWDTGRPVSIKGPSVIVFGGWIPGAAQNGADTRARPQRATPHLSCHRQPFSRSAHAGHLLCLPLFCLPSDVWISGDFGRKWYLVSGRTSGGYDSAAPSSSFTNNYNAGVASVLDNSTQTVYRLGGLPTAQSFVSEVWSTTDAVHWKDQSALARTRHASGFYPFVVSNSQSHLIEAAGGNQSGVQNDVFISINQGRDWKVQTSAAPFAKRYAGVALGVRSDAMDKDVMFVIGGQGTGDNLNGLRSGPVALSCTVAALDSRAELSSPRAAPTVLPRHACRRLGVVR